MNAISDEVLGDKKIEYPEETNMMMFPYRDWKLFIVYNIKDDLLIAAIENKVHDVETYYHRSMANYTPYAKIFRETYLLRNVREVNFNAQGWVQSNNLNKIGLDEDKFSQLEDSDEEKIESTFKGAITANPKMNEKNGLPVLGSPSNIIFPNAIDFDMSSFYPSVKIASNMDPDTMIYKANLINEEFISGEYNNRSLNTTYNEKDKNGNLRPIDISGQMVHTYAGDNPLTFGYNYLNFPDIADLYKEVKKKLSE